MEKIKNNTLFIIFIIIYAIFLIWGIRFVPFHPDESTQIFMSSDLNQLLENPLSLSYQPDEPLTKPAAYRSLDAPLPRYLFGFARMITGSPELLEDWQWDKDWNSNLSTGSLPSAKQLYSTRFVSTILLLSSVIICYYIYKRFLPRSIALIAVILLALNPLVLLHGRRAMSESLLIFGVCLFFLSITSEDINPLQTGLALSIAVNAKQSAVLLFPIGIIAVWITNPPKQNLRKLLTSIFLISLVLGLTTFALNPFYWSHPFAGASTSLTMRKQLLEAQAGDHLIQPNLSYLTKFFYHLKNVYFSDPSYFEISNFQQFLFKDIEQYESIFFHKWNQILVIGSVMISISILGVYWVFKNWHKLDPKYKHKFVIFGILSFLYPLGLVFLMPIPWQRYSIPILILSTLWVGFGLIPIYDQINKHKPLNGIHKGPEPL